MRELTDYAWKSPFLPGLLPYHDSLETTAAHKGLSNKWRFVENAAEAEEWSSMNNHCHAFGQIVPPGFVAFNRQKRKIEIRIPTGENAFGYMEGPLYSTFSSADLLYRFRCFFPNAPVASMGPSGYKVVWCAGVKHQSTGYGLAFCEWKGSVLLRFGGSDFERANVYPQLPAGTELTEVTEKMNLFAEDMVELLNVMFPFPEHNVRYYHPAGSWTLSPLATPERYFIVNASFGDDEIIGDYEGARIASDPWQAVHIDTQDPQIDNHCQSLLRFGKNAKIIGPSESESDQAGIPFAEVISSSLLFYRLFCLFEVPDCPAITQDGKIVGVWSVALRHATTSETLEFFDYHGNASVRSSTDGLTKDARVLLEMLCSKACPHPYDGLVACCVA